MSKWKKIILAMKVFLPILVKGIMELWEQVVDAYETNNQLHLQAVAEKMEENNKKQC